MMRWSDKASRKEKRQTWDGDKTRGEDTKWDERKDERLPETKLNEK